MISLSDILAVWLKVLCGKYLEQLSRGAVRLEAAINIERKVILVDISGAKTWCPALGMRLYAASSRELTFGSADHQDRA